MKHTIETLTAFANAEPMTMKEAWSAHHVENVNRRHWQGRSIDQRWTLTCWTERLDIEAGTAVASVNANALPNFEVGQIVRAMFIMEAQNPKSPTRYEHAWPDMAHDWRIVEINGQEIKLEIADMVEQTLADKVREAQRAVARALALLNEIEKEVF